MVSGDEFVKHREQELLQPSENRDNNICHLIRMKYMGLKAPAAAGGELGAKTGRIKKCLISHSAE